jgi:energy-coupling factor transporter ATP-binding protein EcfA2
VTVAVEDTQGHPGAERALASMHVRKLHGKFDYDVALTGSGDWDVGTSPQSLFAVNEARLTLLYGSNGTGKTSLLNLLFHALSPAPNRGHRTKLSRTRFAEFKVELVNGDFVTYRRWNGELAGPYVVEASVAGNRAEWRFTPGESEDDEGEHEVLEALEALAINPALLSDSRAFHSDLVQRPDRFDEMVALRTRHRAQVEDIVSQRRDADLASALDRVWDHLSQLAYLGAQQGSQRADSVYVNVTTAIAAHAAKVGRPKRATIPNLKERVAAIGQRAQVFTAHGLIPEFPQSALLTALEAAQPRNGPLLEHVLTPYLDGLTQRMDALEPGLHAISTFVETVNSFLEAKSLSFRTAVGSEISDEIMGEQLQPNELSSGEKQILLLLANLIAMRGTTALFIVDEPELSLDPEWQRRLMPALLDVTAGSTMQIIAATHSIEIMSRYRNRMRRLAHDG